MKRKNLIAILLAIAVMTLTFGLVACNNNDDTQTSAHKCEHVCSVCNKCTTDCSDEVCKDKCQGHEPETVDMTEGVYNQKMGSYELLIKFYSDTEYYLQNETTGYRGKYEIKDEEITFSKTQPDGSDYNTADHGDTATWLTSNKAIYFYQEDGVTPIDYVLNNSEQESHNASTLVKGVCYAYGTKPNALAYNVEEDKIQSLKGNYGSRTLSHTTGRNFTINDEKAIEQAKFMVKTLPDGAEEGKVESDYFLSLSQKGYETNIPALQDLGFKAGKFTKDGSNYNLTDTITSKKATLTVTETGATLTLSTDATKKVELVNWKKVTVAPTGKALLEKETKASIGAGENVSEMNTKVTFYDNGTVVISVPTVGLNVTGKYTAETGKGLVVTDIGEMTLTQSGLSLTLGGTVSMGGKSAPISATITCTQAELAGLVAPVTVAYEFSGTAMSGAITLKAYLYSDNTVKVEGTSARGTSTLATGTWATGAGLPTITLNNNFTATISATSATDVKLTLHGDLGTGTAGDYELTKAQPAPAVTVAYEFGGTAMSGAITLKAYLYSDNTVKVEGTSARGTSTLATGTWATGAGLPTITLNNNFTATISATSATDVKLVLHGDLGTGTAGDYELSKVTE